MCSLMGLCYAEKLMSRMLEGLHNMRESTTFQAILKKGWEQGFEEGRIEGAQRFLIHVGTKRFGKPETAFLTAIEAIRDVEQLESLGDRIIEPDVRDWDSLLGGP